MFATGGKRCELRMKNGRAGIFDMFETIKYRVIQIDGDYAHLQKTEDESEEPKLVARALLPAEIREGSVVIYEMLQYRMEEV